MGQRTYTLRIVLFGGHEHLVTVDGTCRRERFASAIRSSAEPEAISSVELLSDDGWKVNAGVEYYGGVPYAETTPPTIRLYPDDTGMRAYRLSLEMFGGGQGDEYTLAPGRAEAMIAVVYECNVSDRIRQVSLCAVGRTLVIDGDHLELDGTEPYGGVTVDVL